MVALFYRLCLLALFLIPQQNILALSTLDAQRKNKPVALQRKFYLISEKNWIKEIFQQELAGSTSLRKVDVHEPSKLFKAEFYDKNELKIFFTRYSYIRDKLENPVNLSYSKRTPEMEFQVIPHLNLPGLSQSISDDINVTIEFKALFF